MREAVGLGIDPLPVGVGEPVVEILLVFGLDGDFEGNDAEDGRVDVIGMGNLVGLCAAGEGPTGTVVEVG